MGRFAPSPRVQRFKQNIGNIAWASGASPFINVPQSDYTLSFDLISSLTITTGATAPVIAGYGAFGPLGQVTVKTQTNRRPFSMSGWQADIYNRIRQDPYNSQLTASPVATSTANTWVDHLHIPLTIDESTERGAWFTGDTQLQMSVVIQCAPVTQVFSTVNSATIAGSWNVYREAFSAPPPDQPGGWLDAISWYHELGPQGTFQLKNGTTPIDLPRDADYLRVLLFFYTGSNQDGTFAPADGLYKTVDLIVNDRIHVIDAVEEGDIRFEMVQTDTLVLPAGTAALDFIRLKSDTSLSRRDVLPTDSSVTSHLQLRIVSTSANNFVDVVTETVTDNPFAARWVSQALANQGKKAA
jgi:hypothetical protein